jgi:hypothetical protein
MEVEDFMKMSPEYREQYLESYYKSMQLIKDIKEVQQYLYVQRFKLLGVHRFKPPRSIAGRYSTIKRSITMDYGHADNHVLLLHIAICGGVRVMTVGCRSLVYCQEPCISLAASQGRE